MANKANAVLLHTERGGRDPDSFYHVLTEELADRLDDDDPWIVLADAEGDKDDAILAAYIDTRAAANRWCRENGYKVVKTMNAVGY